MSGCGRPSRFTGRADGREGVGVLVGVGGGWVGECVVRASGLGRREGGLGWLAGRLGGFVGVDGGRLLGDQMGVRVWAHLLPPLLGTCRLSVEMMAGFGK